MIPSMGRSRVVKFLIHPSQTTHNITYWMWMGFSVFISFVFNLKTDFFMSGHCFESAASR